MAKAVIAAVEKIAGKNLWESTKLEPWIILKPGMYTGFK